MFEKATRMKFRFNTNKGVLRTEDLWDLGLQDLNSLAKSLNKELKAIEEEDFLKEVNKDDAIIKLKFDIVILILETKKKERDDRKEVLLKKAKKEKILDILAKKDDESLENLSKEELEKELENL